jgi:hypothetical protein
MLFLVDEIFMNIAVATCAIGDSFCKTVQAGLDSKKEYCDTHDYDLVIGGDEIYDKDRPPAWSKINLLRKILGDYDVVFLSDADVVITNPLVRLEHLINQLIPEQSELTSNTTNKVLFVNESDKLILVSRDSFNLCTGNMFFRNDARTLDFLEEMYAQTQFIDDPWWEQRAFIHLYKTCQHVRDMTQVVGPRIFNTYEEAWSPGSFLVHLPSQRGKLLEAKMQQYWKMAKLLPDVLLRQLYMQSGHL